MEAATIINLTGNPFGEKLAVRAERVAELLDLSLSQVYKMCQQGVFEALPVSDGKRAGKRIVVASVLRWLAGETPSHARRPSVGERADQARRRQRASASLV